MIPVVKGSARIKPGTVIAHLYLNGVAACECEIDVDTVDAGVGETVLVVSGSSARMASGMKDCPVDAAIVGIVDAVEMAD